MIPKYFIIVSSLIIYWLLLFSIHVLNAYPYKSITHIKENPELFSDHKPIVLEISFMYAQVVKEIQPFHCCRNSNEIQGRINSNTEEKLRSVSNSIDLVDHLNEASFKLADIIYRAVNHAHIMVGGDNEGAIKNVVEGKQVWFDRQCSVAQSKLFKWLNLFSGNIISV